MVKVPKPDEIAAHMTEMVTLINMSDKDRDAYFQSLPPDGTSTKLVMDLMAKPPSAGRDRIIGRAKAFMYDDFKSTLDAACPKMELVAELLIEGYEDIARKVSDGEYD